MSTLGDIGLFASTHSSIWVILVEIMGADVT